ncbi:ABC transporter substrate-binding protein [Geodermatophilus sp. DSM 44513]|uniref:ABC transporter substrate-binding protein n=1 Tax=Geodermatophilus sp. DSM 44513 TaxID=1528104 RepID=UPI00126F27CF|nr:ABC transporter substrate-binding protein [Geodermatophilus sp. DSM 44513]WNV77646.1 ABC transporter substrate-binding protein [Geodermatophilus sp. DSM 44513]
MPTLLLPPSPPGFLPPADLLVDQVTRRDLLRGAGLLTVAGVLAACGGSGSGETTPAAGDGGTRGYTDDAGRDVDIPVRPQRIVATHGRNAGGLVLALGGPVVGIATRDGGLELAITRYFNAAGIETVGEYSEPDVKKIATLRPDLIVHQAADGQVSLEPEVVQRLEQLAPVVGFDVFQPVETVTAKVVELLGTPEAEQAAAEQRARYEEALGELRAVLGDRWADVTASSLFFYGADAGYVAAGGPQINAGNNILTSLGVSWTPLVQQAAANGQFLGDISVERLPEFDADLLMVSTFEDPDVEALPLYGGLAAVRAGQVVAVPDNLVGTHYLNYTAVAEYLRDQLVGRELRTDLV